VDDGRGAPYDGTRRERLVRGDPGRFLSGTVSSSLKETPPGRKPLSSLFQTLFLSFRR
jgi:hypothetical protein